MERIFFFIGALSAGLGVAAGAFGAHALKARLSAEMLATFEVGVRYQMYHALGLIVVAWVQTKWPSTLVVSSGWCFVLGTILFSGSLYLLTLSGIRWISLHRRLALPGHCGLEELRRMRAQPKTSGAGNETRAPVTDARSPGAYGPTGGRSWLMKLLLAKAEGTDAISPLNYRFAARRVGWSRLIVSTGSAPSLP
jgi:uncharacterized membrane protein YgdD (TMEM256/DUF423 family)